MHDEALTTFYLSMSLSLSVHEIALVDAEFIAVCATLKQDMLEIMSKEHEMPQEAIDWVDEVRPDRNECLYMCIANDVVIVCQPCVHAYRSLSTTAMAGN
jgi:hypothetical protein